MRPAQDARGRLPNEYRHRFGDVGSKKRVWLAETVHLIPSHSYLFAGYSDRAVMDVFLRVRIRVMRVDMNMRLVYIFSVL